MVRVFQKPLPVSSAQKVSIDFLLNTTPQASFDRNRFPCSAGVEQLLNAAEVLGKRTFHSTTSSESTTYADDVTTTELVQPLKPKRRKRKDVRCNICARSFGDSSSLRKHHRVVHLKIKEFKCDDCDKRFAEKSNRSKHYIAAHLNQRSHPCPDCDKVFNFTDGLRRHRNNVHLNLRPFQCFDCNTHYKQKTHLLKHRQSVHGVPLPPKRTN